MRFDVLLAMIGPGLLAPLALMAGGFLLAAGGLVFLLLRRRKSSAYASGFEETDNILPDLPAEDETVQAAAPAPQSAPAAEGKRRRPLVAGAERAEGTPAGWPLEEDIESADSEETIAAEGEFEDADNLAGGSEFDESEISEDTPEVELDAKSHDVELEPEWIEEHETAIEASTTEHSAAVAAGAATTLAVGLADHADTDETVEPRVFDEAVNTITATDDIEVNADAAGDEDNLPVSAEVTAALRQPIVFRQFLPQSPVKDGLSFYGGQPIAPDDFQWPRERGAQGGAPLQFIMQWDCSQLTEQDPTGLLPQDGVLYCFVNCDRGSDEPFLSGHSFLHLRGPVSSWKPIAIPDDAGPALGKSGGSQISGCTDQIDNAHRSFPRILPRFPFAPIAFDYPSSGDQAHMAWSNDAAASALLEVQKNGVAVRGNSQKSGNANDDLGRPFPAFPHDFGAIRVVASRMIDALQNPDQILAETLYPDLSDEERETQFAAWCEEAKELYLLGIQRPEGHKLEQIIADDIWQWVNHRKGVLGANYTAIAEEAVDLSLGVRSEALGSVPAEWINKAMDAHALAKEYEAEDGADNDHRICAPTPARIFGPASAGNNEAEALSHDHILLLELPSGAGPQHHFGGNVLQYWITADDLAAGKFDTVKSVVVEP
ncbi:MAG: DUF1963 domain-containing protein [Pseudomonadota bacterium]